MVASEIGYIVHFFNTFEYLIILQATTEGPCSELPEILEQYNSIPSSMSESEPGVVQILTSFRDFTTTLWLLHARDTLSKKLRQKETYLNNVNYQDYVRVSCHVNRKKLISIMSTSRTMSG